MAEFLKLFADLDRMRSRLHRYPRSALKEHR
jgi:hypothetical protein